MEVLILNFGQNVEFPGTAVLNESDLGRNAHVCDDRIANVGFLDACRWKRRKGRQTGGVRVTRFLHLRSIDLTRYQCNTECIFIF